MIARAGVCLPSNNGKGKTAVVDLRSPSPTPSRATSVTLFDDQQVFFGEHTRPSELRFPLSPDSTRYSASHLPTPISDGEGVCSFDDENAAPSRQLLIDGDGISTPPPVSQSQVPTLNTPVSLSPSSSTVMPTPRWKTQAGTPTPFHGDEEGNVLLHEQRQVVARNCSERCLPHLMETLERNSVLCHERSSELSSVPPALLSVSPDPSISAHRESNLDMVINTAVPISLLQRDSHRLTSTEPEQSEPIGDIFARLMMEEDELVSIHDEDDQAFPSISVATTGAARGDARNERGITPSRQATSLSIDIDDEASADKADVEGFGYRVLAGQRPSTPNVPCPTTQPPWSPFEGLSPRPLRPASMFAMP